MDAAQIALFDKHKINKCAMLLIFFASSQAYVSGAFGLCASDLKRINKV